MAPVEMDELVALYRSGKSLDEVAATFRRHCRTWLPILNGEALPAG